MVKVAVTIQERLEKLLAGVEVNPTGPALNTDTLQTHIRTLNDLEYRVTQAKLALTEAVRVRDEQIKQAMEDIAKAEYALKAHYGPRAVKLKEYILPAK
jgi:hypothetical protein